MAGQCLGQGRGAGGASNAERRALEPRQRHPDARSLGATPTASQPTPRVVAELVPGADKPATAEVRGALEAGPDEPLRYRHVRLSCGGHVLSEADNWYRPSKLTPQMNQALDSTDIAFGRAIQALHFHRRTLSAELLWSPLPAGWEMQRAPPSPHAGALVIPDEGPAPPGPSGSSRRRPDQRGGRDLHARGPGVHTAVSPS